MSAFEVVMSWNRVIPCKHLKSLTKPYMLLFCSCYQGQKQWRIIQNIQFTMTLTSVFPIKLNLAELFTAKKSRNKSVSNIEDTTLTNQVQTSVTLWICVLYFEASLLENCWWDNSKRHILEILDNDLFVYEILHVAPTVNTNWSEVKVEDKTPTQIISNIRDFLYLFYFFWMITYHKPLEIQ